MVICNCLWWVGIICTWSWLDMVHYGWMWAILVVMVDCGWLCLVAVDVVDYGGLLCPIMVDCI